MDDAAREAGPSLPTLEEARGWEGHRIDELDGASVARADGVFVDTDDGRPVWLIAKVGRFGKLIAIPFGDCAAAVDCVWVPHTREALRGAPAVDPGRPLTREQELAICAHYGIEEDFGRARDVAAREPGAITSHRSRAGA